MIKIKKQELTEKLQLHKKWLTYEGGERADLRGADLCGADLRGADLRGADLRGADLCDADLCDANLRDANLCGADLCDADLRGANLCGANLCGADLRDANLCDADLRDADLRGADLCDADLCDADLRDANLCGADLCGADLRGANLCGADLCGADLCDANKDKDMNNLLISFTSITPEGDIIGYKKCKDNIIAKLLIPKEAKRSNATGRKCRAEFVKVLEIYGDSQEAISQHDSTIIYKAGDFVYPDKYDDNRWNECSSGIHFFLTKLEAERY